MSTRVVYVARNDGTDMRVSKECNSLLEAGYDVHFVGWKGDDDVERPDPMPDVPKHLFVSRGGGPRGPRLVHFLGFARHVAKKLRELEPDVVHCSNEELAMLALVLKRRHGFRVVCDLFDSIALKWGEKTFPLGSGARAFARHVHRMSDVVLVTDERRKERLGPFAARARIVANYPVDVGEEVASHFPPEDGPVRLYVAGSLYRPRGLEMVHSLLERRDDVEVLSAGWVADDSARRLVQHPDVDFRGVVTPAASLRLAASCHAIVALYEPSNRNNILASPNKIYDALCIGRPVVINVEAAVSDWVDEQGVGHLVRYGSVDDLSDVVDRLKASDVRETAHRLRALFREGYSWDVAEQAMLDAYAAL